MHLKISAMEGRIREQVAHERNELLLQSCVSGRLRHNYVRSRDTAHTRQLRLLKGSNCKKLKAYTKFVMNPFLPLMFYSKWKNLYTTLNVLGSKQPATKIHRANFSFSYTPFVYALFLKKAWNYDFLHWHTCTALVTKV